MYINTHYFAFFALIAAVSALCSNDTRFTTETCAGDINITCILAENKVYCDGFSHRFEDSSSTTSGPQMTKIICDDSNSNNKTRTALSDVLVFVSSPNCKHCLSGGCNGGPFFCDQYNCVEGSNCFCELRHGEVGWKHKPENKPWMKGVLVGISISIKSPRLIETFPPGYDGYTYNDDPRQYEYESSFHEKRVYGSKPKPAWKLVKSGKRIFEELPDFHWEQPKITVYAQRYQGLVVYLDKNTKSVTISMESQSLEYIFDQSWLLDADKIQLRVYNQSEASRILSATLEVYPVRICSIPDNVFGPDFRNHFSCFPTSLQAIYVFFFVFIAIIVFLLIVILVLCIKNCAGGMNVSFKLTEADKTVMLVILILLPCALACDDSLAISATGITCFNSGDFEVCHVTMQTLASLPYPGFVLCYDVIDPERNVKLGNFSITLEEVTVMASMNLMYYTSQWSSRVCADKWCPNSPGCGDDDNCNTFTGWTGFKQASADNKITGSCVNYPGRTRCYSSCGCAGCGCFYCSDACTYIRWSTIPVTSASSNSTIYSVYSIGSFSRKPKVTICWNDFASGDPNVAQSTKTCSTGYFSTNDPIPFGLNFTLTVLGNLESTTIVPPLPNVMISTDSKNSLFVTASPLNSPNKAQIGDIQGASSSKFTSPTYNSFIVDQSIATCSPSGSGGTCSFAASGVNQFKLSAPRIPGAYNGKMFTLSANKDLVVVDPNPGATLIRIFSNNFTFIRKVDVVCPKVAFVNSFGSFASIDNPRILLSAYSTCVAGNCVLSSTSINLVTPSLALTTSAQDFEVKFSSTVKHVSGEICCANMDKRDCVTVDFSLDDPIIDPNSNDTNDGDTGSLSDSFWNDWALGQKIGFIVGLSIGLILIVCLLGAVAWYLWFRGPFDFKRYEKVGSDDETPTRDPELRVNEQNSPRGTHSASQQAINARRNRVVDRFM